MIKLLHAADLHLDSPITGRSDAQAGYLRRALGSVPGMLADLCRKEKCNLAVLSGDIFDAPPSSATVRCLKQALEEMAVPVFIAPGNHDPFTTGCVWDREIWPDNVTVFRQQTPVRIPLPQLDCEIYGAAFQGMDCPGLLENFRAKGQYKHRIGVFHGDPSHAVSPYNPITAPQVRDSWLSYLALGHIHKAGSFRAGDTLCAWPGCPMGRGFDEPGEKGVILVTLDEKVSARFVPLDTPRFYDLDARVEDDAAKALEKVLPPAGNHHFYRVTLTGSCEPLDLRTLDDSFPQFPNLELRDRTYAHRDPWENAGEDTLEGMFFRKLRDAMEGQSGEECRRIALAAKLARQILDGQEVALP